MFSTGYAAGIFMREYKTDGAAVNSIVSFVENLSPGETLKFVEHLNSGLDTYFFRHSKSTAVKDAFVSAVTKEIISFQEKNERVNLKILGQELGKFFGKQKKLVAENELNSKYGISREQAIPSSAIMKISCNLRTAISSFKVETLAFKGKAAGTENTSTAKVPLKK